MGTLCTSFQGTGSNSLGHLNGMKLNEKKNLDLSLNEGKKTLVGLCLGESNQGGRQIPAQHKDKVFSKQRDPTMERAARDKMSSPLLEVIKH